MKVMYGGLVIILIAITVIFLATVDGDPLIKPAPEPTPDSAFTAALASIRAFPATVDVQEVSVDPNAISLNQETLTFTLINHSISATKVRSESLNNPDGTKSIVWYGNLTPHASAVPDISQWQDPRNAITLVKHAQTITGTIRQGKTLYELRPVGTDRHVVIVLDGTKMPPERDPLGASERKPVHASAPLERYGTPAAHTTIDVMTVVAQKTVLNYQGDMLALMQLAVALANQSYINSQIGITLRLVAYQVTDYEPISQLPQLDLMRLMTPNDGHMDDSLIVRKDTRADVVIYIYSSERNEDGGQYCGQASQNGSTPDTAFAMVGYQCIVNFTFAHELGHLQSARHEIARDPAITPYPFAHAWRFHADGNDWHTVVGTDANPPTSQRLNLWSNPDIQYEGVPTGDAETADNHRVLELTKQAISTFGDHLTIKRP